MNNVVLIGRLTKDPEVKYTPTGFAILNMTIAIDRPTKEGEEKKTDFPKITVLGKQAENCGKFLKKGRQVGIEGRLETSSYKKGDLTIDTTSVKADRVEFLDSKKEESVPDFSQINGDIPF